MYGSSGLVQETGPVMRRKRPLNKACTGQSDSYSSTRTPVHLLCTSSSSPPLGGLLLVQVHGAGSTATKSKGTGGAAPSQPSRGGAWSRIQAPGRDGAPHRFASLMLYKKQFGPKNFVSFEIIER